MKKSKLYLTGMLAIFAGGVSAGELSTMVVGGGESTLESSSSYAQLVRLSDFGYAPFQYCGASILNNQFLVTAAHCFYDKTGTGLFGGYTQTDYSKIKVVVRNPTTSDVHMSELKEIDSLFIYDGYDINENKVFGDIAVVKLKYPISDLDNVSQVVLPDVDDRDRYTEELPQLMVQGLGLDVDRKVCNVDTDGDGVNDSECWAERSSPEWVKESPVQMLLDDQRITWLEGGETFGAFCYPESYQVICSTHVGFVDGVGTPDGGFGSSCKGDSGGPVYWMDGGIKKQVGLMNTGGTYCMGEDTWNYTELSYYVDWIQGVVANNVTNETADLAGYDAGLDDGQYYSQGDFGFVPDMVPVVPEPPQDSDGSHGDSGSSGGTFGLVFLILLWFVLVAREAGRTDYERW